MDNGWKLTTTTGLGTLAANAIPPTSLCEQTTFPAYVEALRRDSAKFYGVPPDVVGDGRSLKSVVTKCEQSFKFLHAELWTKEEVEHNGDLMTRAGTKELADKLGVALALFSPQEAAMVRLISTEPNVGQRGGLEAELAEEARAARTTSPRPSAEPREEEDEEEEQATDEVRQPMVTPKPVRQKEEGDESSEEATMAATARFSRRVSASGESTVAILPTTRSLVDAAKTTEVRDAFAGQLVVIRGDFPLTYRALHPEGGAPVARLNAFLVLAAQRALRHQAIILQMVIASMNFEAESGSDQGINGVKAFTRAALDKNFATMLAGKKVKLNLSPFDRVYALIPLGDLAICLALLYYSRRPSRAGLHMLKVASELSFVDAGGAELDVCTAAGELSDALAAAQEAGDFDANAVYRAVITAMSRATKFPRIVYLSNGEEINWHRWALGKVTELADRGVVKLYDKKDVLGLSIDLDEIARMMGREDAVVTAVSGGGGGKPPGGTSASVLYTASDFSPACTQCARPYPKTAVICSKCGHARPSFMCGTCHMLTPKNMETCTFRFNGGCPGTRSGGREPTPAEVAVLVAAVKGEAELKAAAEPKGRRHVRAADVGTMVPFTHPQQWAAGAAGQGAAQAGAMAPFMQWAPGLAAGQGFYPQQQASWCPPPMWYGGYGPSPGAPSALDL
jgi:hypothetical protein